MAIEYVVRTRYEIAGNPEGRASGIASAFGGIASAAGKAGDAFDGLVTKAVQFAAVGASLAAAGGLAAIKTGLVDINARLEDTEIGFATIFNMMGASSSFQGGLESAKSLMSDIRKDAAALPGEFADFTAMAQTITAPLLNAGKGIEDIRNLTRDTVVATASLLGTDKARMEQGAREMAQLLEGHAGGHNALGTRLGITTSTMVGSKAFNKATAEERYDFITKKLEKAKESMGAFQNSWSGLTSTMIDGVKMLLGRATMPLFERIKTEVGRINKLLDKPEAGAFADRVGNALVVAFNWLVAKTEWIAKHWDAIAEVVRELADGLVKAFEKIAPIATKIGHAVGGAFIDNPMGAVESMVAARAGLYAVQNAPAAMGAMGGGAAGAGLAGGVVVALIGAFDLLTTSANEAGTASQQLMVEGAHAMWAQTMDVLGHLWKDLADMGRNLWEAVQPVADALGVVLLAAIEGVVVAFDGLVMLVGGLAQAITNAVVTIKSWLGGPTTSVNSLAPPPTDKHMAEPPTLYGTGAGNVLEDPKVAKDAAALIKKVAASHGAGKTNVTVNVQNTILDQADPERLAMSISHSIVRLAKNPQTALGFPTFQHT